MKTVEALYIVKNLIKEDVDECREASMDKEKRWKLIQQTKGFWAELDWMPGAKRLHDFIIRYDPYVLSAYSNRDPNSKVGKMKWLKKHTKFKRANSG